MQFVMVIAFAGIMMSAQPTVTPAVETLVELGCVGSCATKTEINYYAPEVGADIDLMLKVEKYNLCPSHAAGAVIYVDGKFYGRILLSEKAFNQITVPPGSHLRIIAGVKTIHPTVRCIELGNVEFGLYEM